MKSLYNGRTPQLCAREGTAPHIKKSKGCDHAKHFEVNFDGLVGPTHNYAGLSYGNVASQSNAKEASNPKEAAAGLRKMKALTDLGMVQECWPPGEAGSRDPAPPGLHRQRRQRPGPGGQTGPAVLAACYSASSMWTANAATVSPSADTQDGRIHFTPANLTNKFHRPWSPR